jgi:hypothetical protein
LDESSATTSLGVRCHRKPSARNAMKRARRVTAAKTADFTELAPPPRSDVVFRKPGDQIRFICNNGATDFDPMRCRIDSRSGCK